MIRQDQNPNSQVGQYGLNPNAGRSSSRIPIVSDVLDLFSGNGSQPEMQTTTQQNLPDWAIPFAQQGLNLANYYTMNPNYRPSTLDRDYSGIRGYSGGTTPTQRINNYSPLSMPVSLPDDLGQVPTRGRSASRADAGGGTAIANDSAFQGGADTFNFNSNSVTQTPAGNNRGSDTPDWVPTWQEVNDAYFKDATIGFLKQRDPLPGEETNDSGDESGPTTFGDQLTPFQAYDRQRFTAPSDRTVQGENLLAGRINGANPFTEAQAAARGASNYQSQFTPAALNLSGPRANTYNNVNQGLLAEQYGNANQGLTPAQNYSRNFQQNLAQFQDPYTNQVVDQTIKDLDRARRITNNDISGNAARAGAFGGSREALMRTENNRNFADRTAAAVGQLRSQGFQQAADRAQQEQLQRLGLTASDIQNLRGYQSAGNLQGQNISAQDVRDVRGLRSQGALTAQGLRAQSDRDAMNYANQLQMQGNQLGVEQARLAEQFRQGAGALNLQGAGALGNLAQMQTADERQRIADLLASGGAQDARNQQDLDFIYGEFNRELDYPGRQIDLRNAAISPATGSIVTTTQPRYQSSPLAQAGGPALAMYAATGNPYLAAAAAAYGLLS